MKVRGEGICLSPIMGNASHVIRNLAQVPWCMNSHTVAHGTVSVWVRTAANPKRGWTEATSPERGWISDIGDSTTSNMPYDSYGGKGPKEDM